MRQYTLTGRRQLEFRNDVPMPSPFPEEVLVEVKACTVCGRSDLAYFHYHGLKNHCSEGCFGHEIAGVIADIGRDARHFRIGERVFIRTPRTTGYAEFATARALNVGRLPDAIPFEQGSILQLLPLAVHATRGVTLGDSVLIAGQGPVGLMALQAARLRGASRIIATDLDPWRLATSAKLGADASFVSTSETSNSIKDLVPEVDVAIDAVGTPSTINACIAAVRQNGLVVMLGTHHIDTHVTFDLITWERKGLRIHASAEPTDEARLHAMAQSQKLVDAGLIDVASLLSRKMRLEELPEAITHLSNSSILTSEKETAPVSGPPPETLKVAICP